MAAPVPWLTDAEYQRLHRAGHADRWGVSATRFAAAIDASLAHATRDATQDPRDASRRAAALHLDDLALATACIDGHDAAWDHFVQTHRPVLYRAADALDPTGGARELADALYADLYGLATGQDVRCSLLRYYHGRSALATWLRAVLSQRVVDRARARQRLEPLLAEPALPAPGDGVPDPERRRRAELIGRALSAAVAALQAPDRWRLASYYQQQLTLAQIGRLLGEHEATVSRQLARTRRALRIDIAARLHRAGLTDAEVSEAFEAAVGESSPLDLGHVFRRKNAPTERST